MLTDEQKVLVGKTTVIALKLDHINYMFSMNDIYNLVEEDWVTIEKVVTHLKNNGVPKETNIIDSIIKKVKNVE